MELISSSQEDFSRGYRGTWLHIEVMQSWSDRLKLRVNQLGISMAELARRAGVPYDSVTKYMKGGVEQPRGETLPNLARALGVNLLWLQHGVGPEISMVPLVGYSSAGEEWLPVDDHAQGAGFEEVEFALGDADPIAIGVRGRSMSPVYRSGDILICSRYSGNDPDRFLRRDCVVQTMTGACYIKHVAPGPTPGTFTLKSYNPEFPDIEGVQVAWAAPVRWIKRIP